MSLSGLNVEPGGSEHGCQISSLFACGLRQSSLHRVWTRKDVASTWVLIIRSSKVVKRIEAVRIKKLALCWNVTVLIEDGV